MPRYLQLFGLVYSASITYLSSNSGSDVLRSQIVNSGVVTCVSRMLGDLPDVAVKTEAAKLLSNISYSGVSNQGAVLMAQGDTELIKHFHLDGAHYELLQYCANGIANLSTTLVNQISIGYSEAITLLLRLLVDCNKPSVLEASGILLTKLQLF